MTTRRRGHRVTLAHRRKVGKCQRLQRLTMRQMMRQLAHHRGRLAPDRAVMVRQERQWNAVRDQRLARSQRQRLVCADAGARRLSRGAAAPRALGTHRAPAERPPHFTPWFLRRRRPRMECSFWSVHSKGGTDPNVTLDTTRDELTVHLERAFLVSVGSAGAPLGRRRPPRRAARPGDHGRRHRRRRPLPAAHENQPGQLHRQGQARGTPGAGRGRRRRRRHLRQRPVAAADSQPGKGDQDQGARPQRADPRHLRHAGPHRRGPPASRTGPARIRPAAIARRCGATWAAPPAASARAAPAKPSWKRTAASSICASAI